MSLYFNKINISVPTETSSGGGGAGSSPHIFPAINFGQGANTPHTLVAGGIAFFGGSSGHEEYATFSDSPTFYDQGAAGGGHKAPRDGYLMIYVHASFKLISGSAQFTLEVWSKATGIWVQSEQVAAPTSTMITEGESEAFAPDFHHLSLTKVIQVTKDEEIGVILKGESTGTITLGGTGNLNPGNDAPLDPYKYMEIQFVLI